MNLPFAPVCLAAIVARPPFSALLAFGWPALPSGIVPVLVAIFSVAFMVWWMKRDETVKLRKQLANMEEQLRRCERERDLAQEEVFRRLYEERELNKEKVQFEAQLAQYEKYAALARLALGAAHEINNPLLGILSHLELELKEAKDPEARAEIEQCIAGAKRITSTLRGLVNYARPGPLMLTKISLQRLASDTLGFLEGQPMLHDKHVDIRIAPDLPQIHADATQLSQVLMNLLLNAAEATPEGGRITISATKLTYLESIEIRVSDTGAGIPSDVLPHVFEPFFTTKRGKGTGLGLSISEAYVRSHNGEIRADSVPNHGTTITITLPIRHDRSVSEEQEVSDVVV